MIGGCAIGTSQRRRALDGPGLAIVMCKVDPHVDRSGLTPYRLDRVEQGMEFRRRLAMMN